MYTLYLNIWSHIHALLVLSAYKTYKTGCGWNLWMENTRGCDGADHQSVCPSLLITADDQRDVSITTKGIRQCRARPTRWRENLEKKQKWTKRNPELLILMPFRAPPTSRFSRKMLGWSQRVVDMTWTYTDWRQMFSRENGETQQSPGWGDAEALVKDAGRRW